MKTSFLSLIALVVISFFLITENANAQSTDGTLTFTYTQNVPQGTSASKNVMAVWIEDNSGNFIKTKMRYVGNGTKDHLPTWAVKSGGTSTNATSTSCNTTDASTGATRRSSTNPTAFGVKTFTWDGKNVNGSSNGTTVPDGVYKVWIESSYCSPEPSYGQHWLITSFSFTKGTSADHQTPTGDSNFSNITLDWVPSSTSIANQSEIDQNISIFPNPVGDNVGIRFNKSFKNCKISIVNTLGKIIYEESPKDINAGVKTINTSHFTKGVYFVKIQLNDQTSKYKIVVD